MSLKRHHHDSAMDACTSAVEMVFGSALTLAPFVLIVVVARFIGPIYLTFFKGSDYGYAWSNAIQTKGKGSVVCHSNGMDFVA